MTIRVARDLSGSMKHRISIREHTLVADVDVATGGEDAGPSPHDLYDSALGACKALTLLWYAKRKNIPVEDIQVAVERDDSNVRNGTYRLKTLIKITGDVSEEQRTELLGVAAKCPIHKLMTQTTTEIETDWLVE
jgi:putative redox protein